MIRKHHSHLGAFDGPRKPQRKGACQQANWGTRGIPHKPFRKGGGMKGKFAVFPMHIGVKVGTLGRKGRGPMVVPSRG